MPDKPDAAARTLFLGVAAALIALCVFQAVWAFRTKDALSEVQTSLARMKKLEETVDRIEEKLDTMKGDQDLAVDDVTRLARKLDDLKRQLERRDQPPEWDEPEPPQIDWTQPQLFEKAKSSAAEYGIDLTADEVRVPARFVLRHGAIEYLAVLRGGKEHETLISLIGNTPKGERRPRDFGARLNNAIQALGFKRGKPVRFTPAGPVWPTGETAYLFVEWEEKGEKVVVRAEDLVWDRIREKPMDRGKWIYVGSIFAKTMDDAATPVFAADITGEVVSTYTQSPDTIFDNRANDAGNDSAYLVASPRIPMDVESCTFVVRRVDRAPTRTFPDPPKSAGAEDDKAADESKPAGGEDERRR